MSIERRRRLYVGNQKYKQKHRELGLCVDCSRPVHPGYIRCGIHAHSMRVATRNYYLKNRDTIKKRIRELKKRYKKDKRCPACSIPLLADDIKAGYITCENCRMHIHRKRGTY